MQYFPVFMNLNGQAVVIIGAGSVAERKARLLLKAGARVRVVARQANAAFQSWMDTGEVTWLASEYQPDCLEGARLVFAATADSQLNGRVYQDAESRGIPVNVVDDIQHCRFISPAVIDRSPVQVAISTGGAAPVLARRLRAWIETLLPLGLGRVAQASGAMRQRVKDLLPFAARRAFWDKALGDRQLRSWSLQQQVDIEQQLDRLLQREAGAVSKAPAGLAGDGNGRVFLVGGGPGRADLLTLRALQVLGQADVILHDRLVSEDVLDLARRDADRIYVGKQAGNHHCKQEEIQRLMVAEARKGRNVVRLKGGDPFVFGRGGEELEYLRQHNIAYEVVPGVTAAIGCAAYAGIPLTHRDHAQSLSFVTGHLADGAAGSQPGEQAAVDWSRLAGAGRTAVIYMGVSKAAGIRRELLEAGVPGELPVALVLNGTMDNQKILQGTVETLPQLAAGAGKKAPGLLIIGQVAAMSSNLGWFSSLADLRSAA